MPAPGEFFSIQLEIEMSFHQPFFRVFEGSPDSAIPESHRATTILSLRDRAFEITVVQRMIFDLNCETFLTRDKAWSFCHCPAFQNTIQFKTKIVMQSSRIVLLNDKVVSFPQYPLPIAPVFS